MTKLISNGEFSRDNLEDIADALATGYDQQVNVGPAIEPGYDVYLESSTMYAARFIRAAIAEHDQEVKYAALQDQYDTLEAKYGTLKVKYNTLKTEDHEYKLLVGGILTKLLKAFTGPVAPTPAQWAEIRAAAREHLKTIDEGVKARKDSDES